MGGTIDSYYEATKDTAVPLEKSIIPKYMKSLGLYEKIVFSEICMKDSRALNESDRKKMLQEIESCKETNIIITHGTYTMPDSARYLKANLKAKDKKIIFVGSMIPIYGFTESDGPFNLGFAMGKIETVRPGIYVGMNGKIFSPEEVVKLLDQGRFGSIFGDKK